VASIDGVSKRGMYYWGVIEAGTNAGMNTQQLWEAIHEHAGASGLDTPGVSAAEVSIMRGLAGRIRQSGRNLANAQPTYGIDSSMMARAPWARTLSEQNSLTMHQVRFEHTVIRNGEQVSEWRSVMYQGPLPATVGDLKSELENDAQQMADNYGVSHVSAGSITVLEV
jgi:hypothetical protein